MFSVWKIIKEMHDFAHLGREALIQIISHVFGGKGLDSVIKEVT